LTRTKQSAHGVASASEYDRCRLSHTRNARGATASREVLGSFSTVHLASPQDPGLPHPVRSASGVSHPHDGLLLARLPGLVSCRSAHGVPPFRAFPSPGAVTPLGAPCPPAVDHLRVPREPAGPTATPHPRHAARRIQLAIRKRRPFTAVAKSPKAARLQDLAPRDESVASPRRLGQRQARCSPGLQNLVGATRSEPRADASADPPPTNMHRCCCEGNPKEPDAQWPACSTKD